MRLEVTYCVVVMVAFNLSSVLSNGSSLLVKRLYRSSIPGILLTVTSDISFTIALATFTAACV